MSPGQTAFAEEIGKRFNKSSPALEGTGSVSREENLARDVRAAEAGFVKGSEIASQIGFSIAGFTQAVRSGLISPPPICETGGNLIWRKSDAEQIIRRGLRK